MDFYVDEEIASQPDCWTEAAALADRVAALLPQPAERVAFVGCGTSWFMAQILACWHESRGEGEADAFTASEMPDRRYDRVVALTRSGTTTEVLDRLRRLKGQVPTLVVTADPAEPAAELADSTIDLGFADERSVVQTRFATTTLALFRAASGTDLGPMIEQARTSIAAPLDSGLVGAEQITFLGQGWTVGLAHEAALKLRETSSSWAESYPAMDYRHGPIAIAGPGRAVWMFGPAPAGLAAEVTATGALFVQHARDPIAELVLAQRVAVARAVARGANPDEPRHLSRSVVLSG
jgi:fructoselysine-6-P-deglycase FrlB-like protein